MATELHAEDVISLSEKLAALELTPGEAAVLGAALRPADADEVSGFDVRFLARDQPTRPAEFASVIGAAVVPYADRAHEKWIEILSM